MWIFGFWTGLSYGTGNVNVGRSTDSLGIVAEIKASCLKTPSELLSIHTMVVFDSFQERGR